jgi:hypothetical protein
MTGGKGTDTRCGQPKEEAPDRSRGRLGSVQIYGKEKIPSTEKKKNLIERRALEVEGDYDASNVVVAW